MLKDWKKIDEEMGTDIQTYRTKDGRKKLHFGKEYGEYYVLIVILSPNYSSKTEYFSNKIKALKFAKSYMKTH